MFLKLKEIKKIFMPLPDDEELSIRRECLSPNSLACNEEDYGAG